MFRIIFLSEKRDSNPRPRPWQGRALPTELFSQFSKSIAVITVTPEISFLQLRCKCRHFFHFAQTILTKILKNTVTQSFFNSSSKKFFFFTPMYRATSLPSFRATSVGMLRMAYF